MSTGGNKVSEKLHALFVLKWQPSMIDPREGRKNHEFLNELNQLILQIKKEAKND